MLATPALPWAAGTGGTLELTRPITVQQLLAGEIVFVCDDKPLWCDDIGEGLVGLMDSEEIGVATISISEDGKILTITDVANDESIDAVERLAAYPTFTPSTGFPTNSQDITVTANKVLSPQEWAQNLKLKFGSGDWVSATQQGQNAWEWKDPNRSSIKYSATIENNTAKIELVSTTADNNLTGMKLGEVILPPNL